MPQQRGGWLQARRLEIRQRRDPGPAGDKSKAYVHLLNSTLCATERTLCAILEVYQEANGVRWGRGPAARGVKGAGVRG